MQFTECATCGQDRQTCPTYVFSRPEHCPQYKNKEQAVCESCYYNSDGRCSLKGAAANAEKCDAYCKLENSEIQISLLDLVSVVDCIRRIPLVDLQFATEESPNPKNGARNKLLIFATELIDADYTVRYPEFFHNYLRTLQPFMFDKAVSMQDPRFRGHTAYIFNYPCGSQAIQIKAFVKEDQLCLVSFHKTGNSFQDLLKILSKSASRWGNQNLLLCTSSDFTLYLAWEQLRSIACWKRIGQYWSIEVSDFMEQFHAATYAAVSSMIADLVYRFTQEARDCKISATRISLYATMSISQLLKHNDLVNRGIIAALLSAKVLAKLSILDEYIISRLNNQEDVQTLNAWLDKYHLFSGDLTTLLIKGG